MSRTQPLPSDETVPMPVDRRGPERAQPAASRGPSRTGPSRSGTSGRTKKRRGRRRTVWSVTILAFLALIGGGAWAWWNGSIGSVTVREHCTATANGTTAELDPEQAGNAAIIAGVAIQRGMPARAVSIGIATAIQESKLSNISYGDRDSIGLFQQRPSQGWGSRAQILDPVYAANAFYDVLAKVDGFENMTITDVAQKVQRSAFPDAYADHEPEARIMASALSGYSPGGLNCVLKKAGLPAETPVGTEKYTDRATAVRSAAAKETSQKTVQPSGASGTGLRFTVTPHAAQGSKSSAEADTSRAAWSLAQWGVARAGDLNVVRVQVGTKQWQRSSSPDGWTTASQKLPAGAVVIEVA